MTITEIQRKKLGFTIPFAVATALDYSLSVAELERVTNAILAVLEENV